MISNNVLHYINTEGYICSYPTNSDPRGFTYDATQIHFVLENGTYNVQQEYLSGGSGSRVFLLVKEDGTQIYNSVNNCSFTIDEPAGFAKIGLVFKLYGYKARVKIYKAGNISDFSWYSNDVF
jgi:hypothetical protein